MSAPAVQLAPAQPQDAPLLANLLELYAHDLSDVFALDVGADGRYGYPRLELYFREPDRRFAFLIRAGDRLAGFALVTRGSPVSPDPDCFDVAEFFVLRRHRRSGVGAQAAAQLWDQLPGRWHVRVAERNSAALPFWTRVVANYSGASFTQEQRLLTGKRWTCFSFASRPSVR